MALDKNKASAAAQKYLQRGQIDKAIREYETIVQADPDDVRTWLKIGDLHSRNGKVALAVSTYRKVAETYQGKGFFLKAVAVYKKVLDVDPTLTEVYRTLGDVYVKLNLTAEALTQYRLVVGSYERDGRSADAMLLLEEMVELVPDDESNHLRLAEAHAKNCHDQPAIDHFKFVLSRMRKSGRHTEFIKVAERLLYLYPDDSDSVRRLAQAYLATGNTKRALGWLQKLFKQDPSDSRTLALLAETFSQIGRGEKAVAVLRELARIHEQNGDIGKQRKAIERLLELAPHDDVARDALARLNAAHGQGTETDAALLGTDTNFSAGLSVEQRLQMCLSDADLLVKYGLAEHARERLKVAMTLDKSEPKVWLKMRELCVASGDQSGVADACTAAAQLLQDSDMNQAKQLLKEALSAQPDHALALQLKQAIGEQQPSASVSKPLETPPIEAEVGTPSFDDFNMDPDLELSLDDLSLDEFDDLSADSSEFELSLDGFEVEELGFDIDDSRFDEVPDNDEFAELLADDSTTAKPSPSPEGGDEFGGLLAEPDQPRSGALIPTYEPNLPDDDPSTSNFDGAPSQTDADFTMDHPAPDLGELPVDETSEHDLIDLSEFDGLDDLNQAALDALSEVDESDDFGGLLVDTPVSVSLSASEPDPKKSGDDS